MAVQPGGHEINELIDRYNAALLKVISPWVRGSAQAEDVLQEVWIKVHRNLAGFRGDSGIFTWLYRIAVNTAISHGKKWSREDREQDETADPKGTFNPEKELEKSHLRKDLAGAVGRLSGRHREVFLLRAYNGMAYGEIAESLEISEVNARVLYHHAIGRLRKELRHLRGL
jgi:RNA polymerase sigma-70 factor (ECF subfamily)